MTGAVEVEIRTCIDGLLLHKDLMVCRLLGSCWFQYKDDNDKYYRFD